MQKEARSAMRKSTALVDGPYPSRLYDESTLNPNRAIAWRGYSLAVVNSSLCGDTSALQHLAGCIAKHADTGLCYILPYSCFVVLLTHPPRALSRDLCTVMQLRSIQQLKGLQRLLSADRLSRAAPPCCSSLQQPVVQQWYPPTISHAVSHISSSVTKQQPCRNLLQPAGDVSRYHSTRYIAVCSSAASGETDSVAAVKRLVSASLASVLGEQPKALLPQACSTLCMLASPRVKDVQCLAH
jgi:hypothetical protein